MGSASALTGESDAPDGLGVARSALVPAGADGMVTTMDGRGERSDTGVASEGEAVGSHASATKAATRAARTDPMICDRLMFRVRDSGAKYYMNRFVQAA